MKPERVQCGRTRKCGWIGTTDDYAWRRTSSIGTVAICPKCGHEEFIPIDRLTQHQSLVMGAVRGFLKEEGIAPLTNDVRYRAFSCHENSTVRGWLDKLARWGHLTKEAQGSKIRWVPVEP